VGSTTQGEQLKVVFAISLFERLISSEPLQIGGIDENAPKNNASLVHLVRVAEVWS
jgi:hypothetical protein